MMNVDFDSQVQTPASTLWERCEGITRRLTTRHAWMLLASCLLLLAALSLAISVRTPFWYDELYTVRLSRLPSLGDVWEALSRGVDLQPPVLFVATRASWALFGTSEAATRLPSLLGFALMTTCLFWFVGRRTGPLWGAVACLAPMVTGAFAFSYEARPYGLMLGFAAMALLSWQLAAEGQGKWAKPAAVFGLWLSLALAVSSHYYAVLVFVPLLLGEGARSLLNKRIDWSTLLSILLACPVVLVYLPLIRGGIALQGGNPWNPPSLTILYTPFELLFASAMVPFGWSFAILYFVLRGRDNPKSRELGLSLPEAVACLGFLLIPVPAYLLARMGSNMIHPRYLLPIIIGFSVLFALGLWKASGRHSVAAAVYVVLLAGWFTAVNLYKLRDLPVIASQFRDPVLPAGRGLEALPLVFADALQFMQLQQYGSSAVRSRALYVVGPNEALRHIRANTIEKNLLAARPFFSVPTVSWEDLPRRYPRFLLVWRRGTFVWLPSALEAQNAHMTFVTSSDDAQILLVDLSDSTRRPASTN